MAWGRKRTAQPRASELERLASEAEALVLAMPATDREQSLAAVAVMVEAGAELRLVPPQLWDLLGRLALKFLLDLNTPTWPGKAKPDPARMILQMADGAPTLIGPHRAALERWLASAG